MSENDKTQAAMDRLFGVKEPRINIERPAGFDGAVKLGRNAVFSRALLEARALFPNDGLAQHRFAERESARVMQATAAASASSRTSQEILVDRAFLEVFGGTTGGAGLRLLRVETFSDRIIGLALNGKLYKVPYTVSAEGVTFGSPEIVENLADEQQA